MCRRDRSMAVIQALLSFLMADTDKVNTCVVEAAHDSLHCFDLLYKKKMLHIAWICKLVLKMDNVQQNSVNPTCMGPDRCQTTEYFGLSGGIISYYR